MRWTELRGRMAATPRQWPSQKLKETGTVQQRCEKELLSQDGSCVRLLGSTTRSATPRTRAFAFVLDRRSASSRRGLRTGAAELAHVTRVTTWRANRLDLGPEGSQPLAASSMQRWLPALDSTRSPDLETEARRAAEWTSRKAIERVGDPARPARSRKRPDIERCRSR